MANEIRTNILKEIGENKFSITSDGWMKPSKFPALLSITTHTVTDNFQRRDNVFAALEILFEHTGEEIANLIQDSLVKNGLNIDQIVACVREDARNMQKSCRLLGIEGFQCSAHMYHLCVRDALQCNETISELIVKVRKWVGGTHRSNLAILLKKFQESEGLPLKKIPIDINTRWNSTFLMLSTFSEMKNPLIKIDDYLRKISETQKRPTNMSQIEWTNLKRLGSNLGKLEREDFNIITELCKILKLFHVETLRLSQEQSTASSYIPTAKKFLTFLREKRCRNEEVQIIFKKLEDNLNARLSSIETNKIMRLSMLLDPRFAFDEEYLPRFEWDILEEEFIQLSIKNNESGSLESFSTEDIDEQVFNDFSQIDEDSMEVDLWERKTKSPAAAEFNLLRHGIERPLRNENVFEWWRKNKLRFPLIAEGAKCFLCVPATSVSSERTFSMAGLLYGNTLRNSVEIDEEELEFEEIDEL
uniref:HAT C-terminal dimerisation domain-containing protein n=1 Tax=Meloidogyne floridensis TaxID=298350 RepID=A0A915NI18_9BILA